MSAIMASPNKTATLLQLPSQLYQDIWLGLLFTIQQILCGVFYATKGATRLNSIASSWISGAGTMGPFSSLAERKRNEMMRRQAGTQTGTRARRRNTMIIAGGTKRQRPTDDGSGGGQTGGLAAGATGGAPAGRMGKKKRPKHGSKSRGATGAVRWEETGGRGARRSNCERRRETRRSALLECMDARRINARDGRHGRGNHTSAGNPRGFGPGEDGCAGTC